MALWMVVVILLCSLYFAARCATDFTVEPPRYWRRPASYGQVLLLASILWSIGWVFPTLWRHRDAFDRADRVGAEELWADLAPYVPAALGAPIAGLGILLLLGAYSRLGTSRHCRHCGYHRAGPGRMLTPRCPECGERWSWFGDAAVGEPNFDTAKALLGALLAAVGISALYLQP